MVYIAHKMREEEIEVLVRGVFDEVKTGSLCVTDNASHEGGGFAKDLETSEVVVCQGSEITKELVEHCQGVRWFHSVSAGVNQVPFELLERRGILLSNSRGIHAKPIAEQAFGMMISFTRGLHVNVLNQQQKTWERVYPLSELTGQTLCIVGSGTIGAEVARKARAFDMRVIGVKRHPAPLPNHDKVVGMEGLGQAVAESDFVIVLAPLTVDTHHLIDANILSRMKESATLLNFARGDLIDEEALISALRSGQIRGAALDVFHEEPLPVDSPLWEMENVLISPHTGGWTSFHNARLVEILLANYRAYRQGCPLPTGVNLKLGY